MRPSLQPEQEGEAEPGLGGLPDGTTTGCDEDTESGGTQGTLGGNRRFGAASEFFVSVAGGDRELARWIQFNLQEETLREHRLRMDGNGVVWLTAAKAFSELFEWHLEHWAC
jgi:hypothetical protein